MQPNLLNAIKNIVDFNVNDLKEYTTAYQIRINAVGEQLEYYLKDAFSGSFKANEAKKEEMHSKVFSYLGNQNHPPDVILKDGDAFEIKKMGKLDSALALNSSYPKDRLHYDDVRITDACKNCEGVPWSEKELFYVVGYTSGGKIKHLFFVHGRCYAAERKVYEKIYKPLKEEVSTTIKSLGFETGETQELGKVRRVDPLGITELRVRGMWSIQNPVRVFSGLCPIDESKEFSLVVLLTKSRYELFPKAEREVIEKDSRIKVSDVKVKDPNNPAKSIDAKLITAGW